MAIVGGPEGVVTEFGVSATTLEEMLDFLDDTRTLGTVNMFAAGSLLQREFSVNKTVAKAVLAHWMKTYPRKPLPKAI